MSSVHRRPCFSCTSASVFLASSRSPFTSAHFCIILSWVDSDSLILRSEVSSFAMTSVNKGDLRMASSSGLSLPALFLGTSKAFIRFWWSLLSVRSSMIFLSLSSAITCTSCKLFFNRATSSPVADGESLAPATADKAGLLIIVPSDGEMTPGAVPSGVDIAFLLLFILPSIMARVSSKETPLSSFSTALRTSSRVIRPFARRYSPLRTLRSDEAASLRELAISSNFDSVDRNVDSSVAICSFSRGTEEDEASSDPSALSFAANVRNRPKTPSLSIAALLATLVAKSSISFRRRFSSNRSSPSSASMVPFEYFSKLFISFT
mmetsp:Transcript_37733/g.90944  ORF Transcript_37733/g.90944 Transcript_37733/m.90944 type:complete len:321 (-) Transcript_37733:1374-2336(-)